MKNQKIKFLTAMPEGDGVLNIKYADIETISYLPQNIKAHDIEGIRSSIETFGFVEPIGINRETGHDIFGNGRLETLKAMFAEGAECPKGIVEKKIDGKRKWFAPIVDGLNFSQEQETILAIRLNVTNQKGGIDNLKAYNLLKKLKEQSQADFEQTGYTVKDLEQIQMLAKFKKQLLEIEAEKNNGKPVPEIDGDDFDEKETTDEIDTRKLESLGAELNKKWQVSFGDVFQIGNHRLACGDSQVPETYRKLLDGTSFRLLITSPPYDNQRSYELEEKLDWTSMMCKVSRICFEIAETPSDILINLGPVHNDGELQFYWNDWLDFCKTELKNPLYGLYVWDKLTGATGNHNGRLAPAHEFFFHFSFGRAQANKWIEKNETSIQRGAKKTNYRKVDGTLKPISSPEALLDPYKIPDSVIRMQKELARGIHTQGHPATYPVKLPAFLIKTYSLVGDIVLEPFAGSGTTILAAESLDRHCYAIEISPNYCALILERIILEYPKMEIKRI